MVGDDDQGAWEDDDGAYGLCECRDHAEIRPFPPTALGGVSVKVREWSDGPVRYSEYRTYVLPQEG